MKTYYGSNRQVEVYGAGGSYMLPPYLNVKNHSPDGFAWGYGGSGPSQLALAICIDALEDTNRALKVYLDFKFNVIEKLSKHEFSFTKKYVLSQIEEIEKLYE